jgi:glucosylceramidase
MTGALQTVNVFETSRAGGSAGAPEHMADKGTLPITAMPMTGRTTITIDPTQQKQQIIGFGAALTEAVASVVGTLPAAKQTEILNAYYGATGSGYTLARTHLGSCDFALAPYTYDDTTNNAPDTMLSSFSIAHDTTVLIPFIKTVQTAVMAAGSTLKLLSSPWTAPAWMKSPMRLQGQGADPVLIIGDYPVYAQYLVKYLKAYAAAGVPVWAITTQNEPLGVGGSREGMAFAPGAMNQFIRDNLGPLLQADPILKTTLVFYFDHNKGANTEVTWANTILKDPKTGPMVAGTAVHWYGSTFLTYPDELDALHAVDPNKLIIFDEGTDDGLSDVGPGNPASATYKYQWLLDDWYWKKDAYDWGYWSASKVEHPVYQPVYRYVRDIIVGLNHWYNGWIDWNAALNKDGGPGHIVNPCAAGILVDSAAGTYYQTPIFYAMQHFSKYIRPGAKVVVPTVTLGTGVMPTDYDGTPTQDGQAIIATAAVNPDKSVAVVLFNETSTAIDYSLTIGIQSVAGTIPAQTIQTLLGK